MVPNLARRLAAAILLAGASLPGLTAAQTPIRPITVPPIAFSERTLANRLRVIVIRDTTTPNVTVQL